MHLVRLSVDLSKAWPMEMDLEQPDFWVEQSPETIRVVHGVLVLSEALVLEGTLERVVRIPHQTALYGQVVRLQHQTALHGQVAQNIAFFENRACTGVQELWITFLDLWHFAKKPLTPPS